MFEVNNFEFHDNQLPEAFNNTVIAHVSDLHNATFGEHQTDLLSAIKEANPDMIAVTGDVIDQHHSNTDTALDFMSGAAKIAPTFYVTGNHEAYTDLYVEFERKSVEAGVIVLRDEIIEFEKDNQSISIIGLDDPRFSQIASINTKFSEIQSTVSDLIGKKNVAYNESGQEVKVSTFNLKDINVGVSSIGSNIAGVLDLGVRLVNANKSLDFTQKLNLLSNEAEGYSIVLSHRPEYFKEFVNSKANLVLSGHTHGGQVRFKGLGSVYAPNQGMFPKYSDGLYEEDGTKMVISRGLGDSGVPFRLNNPPELILVTLKN